MIMVERVTNLAESPNVGVAAVGRTPEPATAILYALAAAAAATREAFCDALPTADKEALLAVANLNNGFEVAICKIQITVIRIHF